jgi:DNA-directed RNA polymerase subunit K/omega
MAEAEEIERYTKFEKARMIGSRALQIAMGAPFLIKLEDQDLKKIAYNPIEIAKMEFEKGIIPITVRRPLPEKKGG